LSLTYVVDCSLVIDALAAREEDDLLRRRLSAPRTLHAPHHLDVEVASAVRGLAAGKKITDGLLTGDLKLKNAAGHHATVILTR
jgi:predicted nucleic acid-binding protein